jgi:hypothetical protein
MDPLLPDKTSQVSWSQWQRERVCTEGKTYSHFVKKTLDWGVGGSHEELQ